MGGYGGGKCKRKCKFLKKKFFVENEIEENNSISLT